MTTTSLPLSTCRLVGLIRKLLVSPLPPIHSLTDRFRRRETIRKQRIESEQRRRDELRDGYARLKDTLPASNQKSSKVSLLDRGKDHLVLRFLLIHV